jgi:hypothetical protein
MTSSTFTQSARYVLRGMFRRRLSEAVTQGHAAGFGDMQYCVRNTHGTERCPQPPRCIFPLKPLPLRARARLIIEPISPEFTHSSWMHVSHSCLLPSKKKE